MIERFEWPDRASMAQAIRDAGYTPSEYRYPPGTYFPPHTHNVAKIVAVCSGRFSLELSGERVTLEPLQGVLVPAHALHDAEVLGEEPVVSIDAMKEG
uniref:Cupin type-2 domain-containing protein n=1 Tax=Magnetococcus massalia (strain MO-1) TaxID=451514 RepID=A0A1S7LG59_MAGMO|nr:Conserved protein of unknown function [Candidatus Magnetococcus massalia]